MNKKDFDIINVNDITTKTKGNYWPAGIKPCILVLSDMYQSEAEYKRDTILDHEKIVNRLREWRENLSNSALTPEGEMISRFLLKQVEEILGLR